MSTPAEVLDIQAELLESLRTKPDLRALTLRQFTEIFRNAVTLPDGKDLDSLAQPMFDNLLIQVQQAHAFHVSADMADLVVWAASQLNEQDRFDMHEAPVGVGIACLDKPLPLMDGRGKHMKVNLLLWAPTQTSDGRSTVVVHLFNNLDDPDVYSQELIDENGRPFIIEHFGRWLLASSVLLFHNSAMGPAYFPPDKDPLGMADIVESGMIPTEFTNIGRLVYAFWLLLNQTITSVDEEHPPRAYARRAQRAGIPPRVTVVRLRREVEHAEPVGPGGMVYHHQWMVRGHWRRQPCGSGLSETKKIWIQPYPKGPAGAPWVQSVKVYSLQR